MLIVIEFDAYGKKSDWNEELEMKGKEKELELDKVYMKSLSKKLVMGSKEGGWIVGCKMK